MPGKGKKARRPAQFCPLCGKSYSNESPHCAIHARKACETKVRKLESKLDEAYRHLAAVAWFFDGRNRGRSPSQRALEFWARLAPSDPFASITWLENYE